MKRFGNTMVMWNLKAMKPEKVMSVPSSPLEVRWSLKAGDNWAITATALTSKLILVKQDAAGQWQARAVADVGDPSTIRCRWTFPSADAKGLWGTPSWTARRYSTSPTRKCRCRPTRR